MNSLRRFRTAALAATLAAVFLVGCNDSSPTEPKLFVVPTPTPTPPTGTTIAGTWTGTFTGISVACSSSAAVVFPASGALPVQATVSCLNAGGWILFSLSRGGNTLTGYALWGDPEFYPVTGTLTDSAMDLTIFNDTVDFPTGPTGPMGTIHVHP